MPTSIYDSQTMSAIDCAKASMLVDTAELSYLTTVGRNNGVPRPPMDPNNDTMYRELIQVLARLPKTIMLTSYRLAEVIFGTQAAIIADTGRAWQFYEVNPNEIVFECPIELIAGSNNNASYMHGDGGTNAVAAGGVPTFTVVGKDLTKMADPASYPDLVVALYYSSAWHDFDVVDIVYDSGTDTSTVTTTTNVPALTGADFYFDVPGDEVAAYRGDYMAPDATEDANDSDNPPVADRVYLYGRGMLDVFIFYMDGFVRAAGVTLRVEEI